VQPDAHAVIRVLSSAFHEHPLSRWLVPQASLRAVLLPRLFAHMVDEAAADGTVDVGTDERGIPQVVAVWFDRSDPSMVADEDAVADPRMTALFGECADRWRAFEGMLAQVHPVTPHHYLMVVGVLPGRQRRGLGTALLGARHHRLDRGAIPSYLVAAGRAAESLYFRLGYLPLGGEVALPFGPVVQPMWRAPQGDWCRSDVCEM
jgi:GNAT superfamily N-acetyltransferase